MSKQKLLCADRDETVNHISECNKLEQNGIQD